MDYFTAKEMFVLGIVLGASLVLIFTLILKGEIDTLQTTTEYPSYWLKGLDLYGQSMVARKEAESVFQAVSDADKS